MISINRNGFDVDTQTFSRNLLYTSSHDCFVRRSSEREFDPIREFVYLCIDQSPAYFHIFPFIFRNLPHSTCPPLTSLVPFVPPTIPFCLRHFSIHSFLSFREPVPLCALQPGRGSNESFYFSFGAFAVTRFYFILN